MHMATWQLHDPTNPRRGTCGSFRTSGSLWKPTKAQWAPTTLLQRPKSRVPRIPLHFTVGPTDQKTNDSNPVLPCTRELPRVLPHAPSFLCNFRCGILITLSFAHWLLLPSWLSALDFPFSHTPFRNSRIGSTCFPWVGARSTCKTLYFRVLFCYKIF